MNVQVKIGDQIFDVEVGDLSSRPVLVKIDQETFEVWPEEIGPAVIPSVEPIAATQPVHVQPAAVPRMTPAASTANVDKTRVVTAPIPGAIISVAVKPGDSVIQGQELCILEAMKMKNAIRAPRAGVIAALLVTVGDHVPKGHPLVEFAD